MARERLAEALAACGAVLKRTKKHLVYRLPNGKSLTVSATPSDSQAERNALADLRRALGTASRPAVVNPPRERREKRRRDVDRMASISPLADALRSSGVAADAELAKARETERDLRWRIERVEADLRCERDRMATLEGLWVMKLYRWLHRWGR